MLGFVEGVGSFMKRLRGRRCVEESKDVREGEGLFVMGVMGSVGGCGRLRIFVRGVRVFVRGVMGFVGG